MEHDSGAGSHAQSVNPADALNTNYRQIGTRKGNGRLLLGAAHSYHASSVAALAASNNVDPHAISPSLPGSIPSIPTRFETVLYAGDQEPDAFLSRVARFKPTSVDLPGPGAYLGDIVSSNPAIKSQSTSFSSKGYGIGFASQTKRFKRRGGGPGPGHYDSTVDTIHSRVSSAPNRGSAIGGTAAFRPTGHMALDPQRSAVVQKMNHPGPGAYDRSSKTVLLTGKEQRKLMSKGLIGSNSTSSLAAAFQTSLHSPSKPDPAFNSGDIRFRSNVTTGEALGAGPAGYNPDYLATRPAPTAHASIFKSTTARTDFTGERKDVPGPGAYAPPIVGSGVEEEKDGSLLASPLSPSRAFKLTGLDRFGRVIEPKLLREILPGPGAYDPAAIHAGAGRPVSPTKSFNAASPPPGVGRHAASALLNSPQYASSPLAASLSHGLPVPRGDQPLAHESPQKRKKRAAGVGGPGKSLLATRGGPGVALSSPAHLLHPPDHGTFGRSGASLPISPAQTAQAQMINAPTLVTKESEIRPPGPSYYNPAQSFHNVQDKKAFHLNTASRWM